MSVLETSNLDNTSHGIILVQPVEQAPPTPVTPAPVTPPVTPPVTSPVTSPVTPAVTPTITPPVTPPVTPDHKSESSFIYDSEPVAPVVSDIIEQTLANLVKKSLEDEDMKKKNSITLTPEVTNIINNIISQTPNTLTDIEKAAIEFINDGKINSKDIPNLVIIIQTIYQFIYSLKSVKFDNKKRADLTATTLKYILHFLVLERKIIIDEDKQADFFTQSDLLIDSCISLLSYSKSLKTKGCVKKIFG